MTNIIEEGQFTQPELGKPFDAKSMLAKVYGPKAIYINTITATGPDNGVGQVTVDPERWGRDKEPSYEGTVSAFVPQDHRLTTSLAVLPGHYVDHFKPEIGGLFAGHKAVRNAATTLVQLIKAVYQDESGQDLLSTLQLAGYQSAKFKKPILPGSVIQTDVTGSKTDAMSGDAVISVEGNKASEIKGMTLAPLGGENPLYLDQYVEMGAQTLGIVALIGLEMPAEQKNKLLPLFRGTGKAELKSQVTAGDNLVIEAQVTKRASFSSLNTFEGNVAIYRLVRSTSGDIEESQRELVATIDGMNAMVAPEEEILNLIRPK